MELKLFLPLIQSHKVENTVATLTLSLSACIMIPSLNFWSTNRLNSRLHIMKVLAIPQAESEALRLRCSFYFNQFNNAEIFLKTFPISNNKFTNLSWPRCTSKPNKHRQTKTMHRSILWHHCLPNWTIQIMSLARYPNDKDAVLPTVLSGFTRRILLEY